MSAANSEDDVLDISLTGNPESDYPDKSLVRQSRLLSWLFSKKVPQVPDENLLKPYPQSIRKPFQFLFFWWLVPLLNIGYKRTIEDADLWVLPDNAKVEYNYIQFNKHLDRGVVDWQRKNSTKDQNSWPFSIFFFLIFKMFKSSLITSLILALAFEQSVVGNRMVSKKLISIVESRLSDGNTTTLGPAIGYSFLLLMLNLIASMISHHVIDMSYKMSVDIQSILSKKVLHKSANLSSSSKSKFGTTALNSLVGNDLSRFEYSMLYLVLSVGVASGVIVIITLLIVNIGVSSLLGIGFMIISIVFQGFFSKLLYTFRTDLNQYTDSRVGNLLEVIQNFKLIKFYNWEVPYHQRLNDIRNSEMNIFLKMKLLRNVSQTSSYSIPLISTMISFLILYKLRGLTDVASIFSSLALFNLLGEEVTFLTDVTSVISDSYSALKRVHKLLQAEEEIPKESSRDDFSSSTADVAIEIDHCSFEWPNLTQENIDLAKLKTVQEEEAYELQSQISRKTRSLVPIEYLLQSGFKGFNKIDLSIKKGEFIIVTGLVGSGKSSFINAIDGSMTKTEGIISINGTKIMCGTPWTQNTSVRENILFGSEFDSERYWKVVTACALKDDFSSFENGDSTEIGERGVTLSGGQKARICLARAVYCDREILLLDDVLSAVDARVGTHIVENCLLKLLKGKTIILATHQLSLIKEADRIIFLNRDSTLDIGTLDEVRNRNVDFANLMSFNHGFNSSETGRSIDTTSESQVSEENDLMSFATVDKEEESKAVNGLGLKIYVDFLFPGEGIRRVVPAISLLAAAALFTFFNQFNSVWLTFWTELKFDSIGNNTYLGLYIMFNFLAIILNFALLSILSFVVNHGSKMVSVAAIKRLLYAPVSFIDVTPMGRIVNRFTKDMDMLDNGIYPNWSQLFNQVSAILGGMILMIVYLPWIALSIPLLGFLSICIWDYSQASIREIKRIEAVRKSFIFSNMSEFLSGLSTIKAYNKQDIFIARNDHYLNRSAVSQYLNFAAQRFLAIQLTIVSSVFMFLIAILSSTGVFHLSASSTGLLLSTVLTFGEQMTALFRTASTLENSMNSAERLYQYATGLVQEAPFKVSENTPRPDWPSNPSIEFQNVSMAYRPELPLVLKDVSFKVGAREKIGICGRTGAGKSSIMTALFRIAELQQGQIVIDGLDVSKMGLLDLRSKLSIIPQESVLFKGTMRFNLDPFEQYSDTVLLEASRKAGLLLENSSSKFDLNAMVEEGGTNFSLGEKQLISLTRALVRSSNILILDEATSSVDFETDSRIQATIKAEFNHCTILCIAHRLKTILDYDRILVLDGGEVMEFDTPYNLFCKQGSIFRLMCDSSDITEQSFIVTR